MLGALAISPQALRADQLTRISGIVQHDQPNYYQARFPVARISVRDLHGGIEKQAGTDANGRFVLFGLDYGPAEVVVEAEGCYPYIWQLHINPGDNLQTTWHMTRAASGMFFGPEQYRPEIVDANPFDRYAIQ
jgi:hypothetical protein